MGSFGCNHQASLSRDKLFLSMSSFRQRLGFEPTEIGDPGHRGEPNIKWSCVETKEAAEMMRDVRKGPSPIFGTQVEETVDPDEA